MLCPSNAKEGHPCNGLAISALETFISRGPLHNQSTGMYYYSCILPKGKIQKHNLVFEILRQLLVLLDYHSGIIVLVSMAIIDIVATKWIHGSIEILTRSFSMSHASSSKAERLSGTSSMSLASRMSPHAAAAERVCCHWNVDVMKANTAPPMIRAKFRAIYF